MANGRENAAPIILGDGLVSRNSIIAEIKNYVKKSLQDIVDNYIDYKLAEELKNFYDDGREIDYETIEDNCIDIRKVLSQKINKYKGVVI